MRGFQQNRHGFVGEGRFELAVSDPFANYAGDDRCQQIYGDDVDHQTEARVAGPVQLGH